LARERQINFSSGAAAELLDDRTLQGADLFLLTTAVFFHYMIKIVKSILFFLLTVEFFLGCGQKCSTLNSGERRSPKLISLERLINEPKKFVGKRVTVIGKLENLGENYFRNLRAFLIDEKGKKIFIKPWVPLEVPPPRNEEKRPFVMSDFLGKKVKLIGIYQKDVKDLFPQVDFYFQVESAEILE